MAVKLLQLNTQVRAKRADFHEIIDRAMDARTRSGLLAVSHPQEQTQELLPTAQSSRLPKAEDLFGGLVYVPSVDCEAV